MTHGGLWAMGQNLYIWVTSATGFSQTTYAMAYYLTFNSDTLYPSGGPNNRWHGYPIRYQLVKQIQVQIQILSINYPNLKPY